MIVTLFILIREELRVNLHKFKYDHCKLKWDIILLFFSPGGYPAPGMNHVIIRERQRDDGGDVALGMLAGAATGLALGSLFSVF